MGRQDARQKKIRRRDKGQKKWGDNMRDEKKMERQDARQKNGEKRHKTKKMGR